MGLHKKKDVEFRDVSAASTRSASARICMPTWRKFTRKAFRCGLYEAQDVLVENDDVDLVCLDMAWGAWFKQLSLRRPLIYANTVTYANPGLKQVQLSRDYDVFIAVCDNWLDLPYLNAIKRWRDTARQACAGLMKCGRLRYLSTNTGFARLVSSIIYS